MKPKDAVLFRILGVVLAFFLLFPAATGCSEDKTSGGVGLNVGQLFDSHVYNQRGPLVVLDVLDGMPAKRVGVEKGDIITHINNEPAEGQTFEVLVNEKMRGPVGSSLTLTVTRAAREEKLYFNMTRVAVKDGK